jgi:hypothetical protein
MPEISCIVPRKRINKNKTSDMAQGLNSTLSDVARELACSSTEIIDR